MLTEPQIRAAKPKDAPYKLSDGRGLHLLVSVTGARLWRFRFHHGGVEKLLTLGQYPDVSLKRAREKRDHARTLVSDGVDPTAQRRAEKRAQVDNFEGVAREWLSKQKHLTPGTLGRDRDRLEKFIFPTLGKTAVASMTAPDLLAALRRIEARGTHETAHRTRAVVGRVLRYAIATGRAERDISADLRGALTPVVTTNFPAITEPRRIGELLRAIDGYVGQPSTESALKLAPLVFVRPGELRAAEWTEFDLKAAIWRIPAARMKARREHIVPLSTQALAILTDLESLTGDGKYLFPSLRSVHRPISDNTLNSALRRLGFSQGEMTAHGFRSMASTRLNEQGFPPDVIELQLAHAEQDEVRGAYNRAQRIAERTAMMQTWADYLDSLRTATNTSRGKKRSA